MSPVNTLARYTKSINRKAISGLHRGGGGVIVNVRNSAKTSTQVPCETNGQDQSTPAEHFIIASLSLHC